jgi:uncharacterized protein
MTWGRAARACLERFEGSQGHHQRWHFQHGPIDLVIGIHGPSLVIDEAIEQILRELVAELALLKAPVPTGIGDVGALGGSQPKGPIARRMFQSCTPYGLLDQTFLTPMAAVAGCVAHEVIEYLQAPGIEKAWVNNGGDIAWYASPTSQSVFKVGIPELPEAAAIALRATDQCWGVATSGWRGRSQSFGIADSVTVIARQAGQADVAATLIANQVSLGDRMVSHPQIVQKPANQVKDESDLGDRLVTVEVGRLSPSEIQGALDAGEKYALNLLSRDWIQGVVLSLQGQFRICGGFLPQVLKNDHPRHTPLAFGDRVH